MEKCLVLSIEELEVLITLSKEEIGSPGRTREPYTNLFVPKFQVEW